MASKGQKVVHTGAGSNRTHSEKPIKLLIEREFRERSAFRTSMLT